MRVVITSPLLLPHAIYQAMLAHARAQYPNEACGLLRGRAGRVIEFLPAQNVSPTPRTDYEVDAATLLRALDWEDEGDELIAIFHSHPVSPAYPSMVDVAKATYPDSVYLILSLQRPTDPELKGYRLQPEVILHGEEAASLRTQLPFIQVRPGLWGFRLATSEKTSNFREMVARPEADMYLVYDHPQGPIRLVAIHPVEILLQF